MYIYNIIEFHEQECCNDNSEKLTVSTSSLFLPEFFDL